jgi:hypothetical protein
MKLQKIYHSSKYYEFFPEKRRKSRDFVLFFRSGDSGSLLDTRKKIRTKNRKKDVVRKKNKKQM